MRILIADDEKNIRTTLSQLFGLDGISVETAENGLAAQRLLSEQPFDAVVLDLRMPGMDGLQVLTWLRESGPQIPAIMISAHGDVQDAVSAMKQGAIDYVTKPFDPEDLQLRVRRAIEDDRLRRSVHRGGLGAVPVDGDRENRENRDSEENDQESRAEETSANAAMQELMRIVRKVAPSESTILIGGESGTGKEVLARTIHRRSPRSGGPFVPVNLGAVPDQLLESELFGYEKGAFTGATVRKPGLFETAAGGTLFLDEIGEMPHHLQVKLLRVLQDRRIQRVGGTTTIPIDVRILAATNRDLKASIATGEFREDLYYRLNVIELRLPALRERVEDIAPLAGIFLERIRRRGGTHLAGIRPEAVRLLSRYRFPGNIRELENIIERAALLAEGEQLESRDFAFLGVAGVDAAETGDSARGTGGEAERPSGQTGMRERVGRTAASDALREDLLSGIEGPVALDQLELAAIRRALLRNEGHRERTAKELGITRRTLLNKIKEYQITIA